MRHIVEAKNDNSKSRLIPFFCSDKSYILEFNKKNIRVLKDDGVVTEITSPYQEDDLFDLQFAQEDALYLTHKNHKPRKLMRITESDWKFNIIGR